LGILLFNWFGYRLLIGYWQEKTQSELEAKLDVSDYDESQLITVKVPVTHLSYYNTSPVFERVNGSIEIGGMQYKYVKRRLYKDSLELLCLPDQGTMKLKATANDFLKHSGAHPLPIKSFVFDPYLLMDHRVPAVPAMPKEPVYAEYKATIPSSFPATDERPPVSIA
jgi:hypothetical protein